MQKPNISAPKQKKHLDLLAAIARGEEAIAKGQVLSHQQARQKMARWLEPSKPEPGKT